MQALHNRFYEFFRFCCVGSIGFLIDYGTMELLVSYAIPAQHARIISIALTMQLMYVLHGRITYRDHMQRGAAPWLKFITTNLLGVLINYVVFMAVLNLSPFAEASRNRLGAVVSGTIISLFFNYIMNRKFAFRSGPKL